MDRSRRAQILLSFVLVLVFSGGGRALSAPRADPPSAPPPIYLPYLTLQAQFHKAPYLVFLGDNTTMQVMWQLLDPMRATLQWGTDTQYKLGTVQTTETGPDHLHSYIFRGLTPGARYYYRVTAGLLQAAATFVAAPPADAPSLKFFAYGDTRNGIGTHNLIASQVISTYTADPAFQTFSLHVGDLVSSGDSQSAWDTEFFDPRYTRLNTLRASLPLVPVRGNHEESGELWAYYFPQPFVANYYWSFDYGPAHFAMVDEYVPLGGGSDQYVWLAYDLARSTKLWKFIVLHEPGWSAVATGNPVVQVDIQPLAEYYHVAIVFGGHHHLYARSVVNGITHLTVGGGGAPLLPADLSVRYLVAARSAYSFAKIVIDSQRLTGTAVQSDGSLIDSFTLTR